MRLLNTKHKQKEYGHHSSFTCDDTAILLFYVGLSYLDPPPENGIASKFWNHGCG